MILFRPRRELLEDAMEQVKEVNNMSELVSVIKSEFMFGEMMDIKENNIEIKEYCYDSRIDWNTHIVILDFGGEKTVIGFTNGNFNEGEK